jgi:hypothetical protein
MTMRSRFFQPRRQPNPGQMPAWRAWWVRDDGRVAAFVVTLVVAILALAGLTLDGGLALASKVQATDEAQSAARAGAQAIDLAAYRASGVVRLAPAAAVTDAQDYLASIGATGTVSVAGDTVTVTVTAVRHTQLLQLVGITALTAHGQASAHPQRGIVAPEP